MNIDQQIEQELSPRVQFEQQMAPISFQELQKHFAKGILIRVASGLDLLDVAVELHADNTEQVKQWMDEGTIERAHDEHAKVWLDNCSMLMAVTVAPWVLVQDHE